MQAAACFGSIEPPSGHVPKHVGEAHLMFVLINTVDVISIIDGER
jgi:hypothetical protein